jgi:cell division protein FtsZ
MSINLKMPEIKELRPKITVFGIGGAGGNAVNNMIRSGLQGCEFVVANTDSQALMSSKADRLIQMGVAVTEGLGAGSQPEIGRAAAEEAIDEIVDHLSGSHMVFVTAGMGGGTGTGAAPIIARTAREHGILTVGVVTKPFHFEGIRRMRVAEQGIKDLTGCVDTLIVIPNQNLFRIANEKTTFTDAFAMADQVLYSGVACITDLMVKEGLINLDFADVRAVMREMGKAMMGTGEASGERRASQAAEAAIANPLLDETSMRGAKGLLISITGGKDLTLFEVDEAATRIREEVDPDANIILGATFDESLDGVIRVSVVATGIDTEVQAAKAVEARMADIAERSKAVMPKSPLQPTAVPAPTAAATASAATKSTAAGMAAWRPGATAAPRLTPQPRPAQPIARGATARSADPAVSIEPYDPGPYAAIAEAAQELQQVEAAPVGEEPYIPPVPQAPTPRIPRVEDFPPHAQRAIEAQREPRHDEDRGPLSLLRRLASVGMGRRDESAPARDAAAPAPAPRPAAALPQGRSGPPAQRAAPTQRAASRTPDQSPTYRPAEGNLDPQGRPLPSRSQEEELEIPAFLRRQAN